MEPIKCLHRITYKGQAKKKTERSRELRYVDGSNRGFRPDSRGFFLKLFANY